LGGYLVWDDRIDEMLSARDSMPHLVEADIDKLPPMDMEIDAKSGEYLYELYYGDVEVEEVVV
jgi:hypothetical protein